MTQWDLSDTQGVLQACRAIAVIDPDHDFEPILLDLIDRVGGRAPDIEAIGRFACEFALPASYRALPETQALTRFAARSLHLGDAWQKADHQVVPVPGRLAYVLHASYPQRTTGYASRAHSLCRAAQRAGIDIHPLTRPGFPADVTSSKSTDFPDQYGDVTYGRIAKPALGDFASLPDWIEDAVAALEKLFREIRPSIVMAASNHITAFPSYLAAKRLGLPFVYEVRGFWELTRVSREPEYRGSSQYRLERFWEEKLMQTADRVLVLTDAMANDVARRGVSQDRIGILPNGCDTREFHPQPRDEELARSLGLPDAVPVIGFAGSIAPHEGLDLLIEACLLLQAQGVDFSLVIVGDEAGSGSAGGMDALRTKAAGLGKRCHITGRVPPEAVPRYLSLFDIVPCARPSHLVTDLVSPLKPLEAMAMEKCVIVSDVGGMQGMVADDVTGMVVPAGNIEALAEALRAAIVDPEKRLSMGREARKYVLDHREWDRIAEILVAELAIVSATVKKVE